MPQKFVAECANKTHSKALYFDNLQKPQKVQYDDKIMSLRGSAKH